MRNILIILMLCFASLASSSVFAAGYDESQRTERLGLSYYDGRPLYVVGFGREPSTGGGSLKPANCWVYRVYSGDKLSDYGTSDYMDGRKGTVYENGQAIEVVFYQYVIDDSGEPQVLTTNPAFLPGTSTSYIEYHLKNLRFTASSGDLGVSVFDAISERVKTWVLAAIIFAGTFLCAKFGFRELLRFAATGLGDKSDASTLTTDSSGVSDDREAKKTERENFEAFRRSWDAVRELGAADAYATGEAYGLNFTSKVVKSNQILQESWSRLSEDERQFLVNEARALAWQDDLIDEKERIYRRTAMQTALLELDGVDSSEVFSNPYGAETSDEDDDPESVPRPGVAPLPYVALEEDEDDGLIFPGEAASVPNRRYRETYDDYDAANRALDEVYYDDEGGYW